MDEIINALHLRNWYALAALTLTLAVQLFRKAPGSSKLWDKIPDGYRWALPMLSGAVTGFTQAFAAGLSLGAAILSAIGGAIGISIPAMGLNSLLTEAPVRWNGGAGGSPPPTKPTRMFPSDPPLPGGMVLLLAIGLAFHTSACSSSQPKVCNPADAAKLTAEYAAKVHVLCQGYTFDSCPARPALEADLNRQHAARCPTGAE